MADSNFTPNIQSQGKQIEKRKIIDFLPSGVSFTKDSDFLERFFSATVDQLFQEKSVKDANGYIGRKSGLYYEPDEQFYLEEKSQDRYNYQLEPTAVSINEPEQENNFTQFYQDLVNKLRFQGAITNNHSRLFSQEYYSWAPPINTDMLINFTNYYWLITGPTLQEITDSTNAVLDIIGQETYTTTSGLKFESGMRVIFRNDANAEYNDTSFIVEGVGRSIQLIDDTEYDGFGLYDTQPYDTFPYDNTETGITPDYITIARGSQDKNPWSRRNRWFHKDLIENLDLENFTIFQARRPIIEFIPNIELNDFGRWGRENVDFIETTYGTLDITGNPNFVVDGVDLFDGARVLITNDPDPAKNNKVYKVYGINAYGSIGLQQETDGLDLNGTPVEGEAIRILKGDVYKETDFYYNGSEWTQGQQKTEVNQLPEFVLYDYEGTRLDDTGIYPESNFSSSNIFSYQLDSSQDDDEFLGFPINFSSFGDIAFVNNISSERFTYELNFERVEIPGYYYYKRFTGPASENYIFENDWHKSEFESRQFVLDNFIIKEKVTDSGSIEFNREYQLSIDPDPNTSDRNNYQVFLNGQVLEETVDYDLVGNVLELSLTLDLADDDVLEVKSWAQYIPEESINGYFEIPKNLEANPNNEEVTSIDFNELNTHFISIIENQPGFDGNASGINNYKNTRRDLSKGQFILNHSAPLLKLMLLTGDSDLDILSAMRYTDREYTRFKNKFVNKITELYNRGYDSSVLSETWVTDALQEINLGKTEDFPFAFSLMTAENNYIPSTPASLGITPVYEPVKFVDQTRLNPAEVIRGHDGSISETFGDIRDDILLELENQIFNNLVTEYSDKERIKELEHLQIRPGYFRDTEYSQDEWIRLSKPAFERWAIREQVDYVTNDTFDLGNKFTWNYARSHAPDGSLLPGNWRGIYEYFYDTDRPHTHPWEMLGFYQKPIWWDTEYGPAPYTGGNLVMWDDLEQGIIRQGPRAGTYPHLARPGLSQMIPVDDVGNLLDPIQAGIVQDQPGEQDAKRPWKFGDQGPGEYTWKINEAYSFGLAEAMYLAKPAKFVELFWEANTLTRTHGQLVYEDTYKRKASEDFNVHNEILDSGQRYSSNGISQWASYQLANLGQEIATNFGDILRDLDVRLGYKVGGFTKFNTLRLINDTFGIIPQENISTVLYKSSSIKEPMYSGVVIEYTGNEYRINGYDNLDQRFKILPRQESGRKTQVTVQDITVTKYLNGSKFEQSIPYNTKFGSAQEVFNFLIDYQRYLESEGWIFDQIDDLSNEVRDFEFAAKQFLAWIQQGPETGQAIVLSPLASEAKIKVEQGQIEGVQGFVNGVYSIIDKNGFGIPTSQLDVSRLDDNFFVRVEPDVTEGIYGLRLSVIEYEHAILMDNETKFNDLIYAPLLGLRQPRLRAFIQKTDPWNGKAETFGFIIKDNDLFDNFEKSVSDIEQFFSFENLEENTQEKQVAKHLIGYQNRDYLENLLLDRKSQFEFYRGFIREKGTRNSLTKILRNDFVTQTADFDVQEEWAFVVGEYGNLTRRSRLELQLIQSDFKTNPQLFEFTNNLTDDPDDTVISITPDDERWVLRPQQSTQQFPLRNFINKFRKDLPNAGYVQNNETTYNVVYNSELENLYDTVVNAAQMFADGDTIWNIILPNQDWTVYRLCSIAKVSEVAKGASEGDPGLITLESNHDLSEGDKIYIIGDTESSPNYEGYHEVFGIDDLDTFELETPVETEKTFGAGEGPLVLVLRPVRFENIAARDAFVPTNGWNIGDRTWVDSGTSGLWEVYEWNGSSWDLLRTENDKVNTQEIYKSLIYNRSTNLTDTILNLYDPYKGLIVPAADREIYYKLDFDPAKYTDGDEEEFQIDPELAWGSSQQGRLWWDLSTTRFLDYEQGDQEYRLKNWGKLAPGTVVDIYEWTRSPVPPSGWDSYVTAQQSESSTIYRPSGTLPNGEDTPYVTVQELNESKGILENVYYFWVLNPTFVPQDVENRQLSAQNVSLLISDVNNQNVPWFAPISQDAFLMHSGEELIDSEESILQIIFFTNSDESTIHKQWKIIREADNITPPDSRVWNKMRDSLVGFDDNNLTVPDPNLREAEKYGWKIRPRQTWFVNRLEARKQFVQKVNKILLENNIVDEIPTWDDNLRGFEPQPDSSSYDHLVFNRNDRDALIGSITPGQKVLVEEDQVFGGKWSLWQFDGGSSFTLLDKQLYRVEDFWELVDWYDEDYNQDSRLQYTFSDIPSRDAASGFEIGDLVQVDDNGTGRWTWYVYSEQNMLPVWTPVAVEQGTIQITSNLYDYDITDADLDEEASIVTKELISALEEDILTILEQNAVFFTMVHYVLNEQKVIDWAFKTSYIFGVGNTDILEQDYIFVQNQSENLIDYIEEAKPYHVKIRGLIENKQVPTEELNVSIEEERLFDIGINFDRISCESNIPEGANPKDYNIDELDAADRVQLLYEPTEGMPEKVLEQLISRCEYGGTVIDGKNFYQFGTLVGVGYDNSEYDYFHGYDFDASDLENFYDIFVNGGALDGSVPVSAGSSGIVIDGNAFVQPHIAADHPEELVKVRSGDALTIDVYTVSAGGQIEFGYDAEAYDEFGYDIDEADIAIPFGGAPKIRIKRYRGTLAGTAGPFTVGQFPQNREALFVYINGELLKETTDYTVDWGMKNPEITLVSSIVDTDELKIVSYSVGGSGIKKKKLFFNTSDTTFDLEESFGTDGQVFVTVDGEIATFTTSGTEITITSPIPSNSTVFISIFGNEAYSTILTQEEIAAGGSETFTIDRPAESTVPVNYATTIVHRNGLRLVPPHIKVYEIENPNQYWKIGKTPVSASNVRVWIDNQELTQPAEFTVDVSDSEVQLTSAPPVGGHITIMLEENHEFEITGGSDDQLTVLDGSGSPLALTAGDSIKITTFSEDLSLGIRTEVFEGNPKSFYPLGDNPFDTNSAWVTVDGERQIHLTDYTFADKDKGYDSEHAGYDTFYDSHLDFGIEFKEGTHTTSQRIVVTYFTGIPTADPIAFKLYKNIFGNWEDLRIADEHSTILTQPLASSDNEITVEDATVLGQPSISDNIPGIIFINGERIVFWDIDTTTPGQHVLKQCLRGTGGTGINLDLPVDTVVRDASKNQEIPGGYYWKYTQYGLQQDNSALAKFLLDKPGTYNWP